MYMRYIIKSIAYCGIMFQKYIPVLYILYVLYIVILIIHKFQPDPFQSV